MIDWENTDLSKVERNLHRIFGMRYLEAVYRVKSFANRPLTVPQAMALVIASRWLTAVETILDCIELSFAETDNPQEPQPSSRAESTEPPASDGSLTTPDRTSHVRAPRAGVAEGKQPKANPHYDHMATQYANLSKEVWGTND